MANTNVDIIKNNKENTTNLVRRFTKQVKSSGVLKKVRSLRYAERPLSAVVRKKQALKRINKTAEVEKMIKLGKFVEKKRGRRR